VAKSLLQAAAADDFPVLDLTAYLNGAPGARVELAGGLRHALETVGFLVVVNHGVPQSMIDDVFAQAARLHALPVAAKQALSMGSGSVGYLAAATSAIKTSEINANRKPDLNEAFFIDRDRSPDDPAVREGKRFREVNKWPDGLPGFREATMAYYARLEAFAMDLLPVFATALDLPPDWFDAAFGDAQCTLRLSHYPPSSYEDNQFGIAPHTDSSFLTVLPQSELEGLYVRPTGSGWMKAPRIPGSFVINSGDMCKRWTNDRFLSTEHLAINPSPDRHRYAVPFFLAPNIYWPIRCMPSCFDAANPPRYPEVTYEQYRLWFLRNNYHAAADAPVEMAKP
jgi:isopenicillin N synthase-like dioxygenase